MGKYSTSHIENPYLDQEATTVTAELVMDEARQKWRAGNWRAKGESFDFSREEIAAPEDTASRPASSRFDLDIRRDLMGETISLASLRELDYSPSYRPKGDLDIADEYAFGPMSTMQRYDVLAGELEAPPDDLSFLSDAQARLRREQEKSTATRSGTLRRDSRRLTESLDKRRSYIISKLPDEKRGRADEIIDEARKRKAKTDHELGKDTHDETKELRKTYKRGVDDPNALTHSRIRDTRIQRLPKQVGVGEDTRELPEFASETRRWSEIQSENPTWSEVAAHTDVSIPKDEDSPYEGRTRYIPDELFSPKHRFMSVDGAPARPRLRSDGSQPFENEYLAAENIDTHRIREIMEKEYHGRWIPPEYFSDDELVNDWFSHYNRGALPDEDYVSWAYRQRLMALQQQQQEAEAIEQSRRHFEHEATPGRRYSPYPGGDNDYPPRELYSPDDMDIEAARMRGYEQGEMLDKAEKKNREKAERAARERARDARGRTGYPPQQYGQAQQPYNQPYNQPYAQTQQPDSQQYGQARQPYGQQYGQAQPPYDQRGTQAQQPFFPQYGQAQTQDARRAPYPQQPYGGQFPTYMRGWQQNEDEQRRAPYPDEQPYRGGAYYRKGDDRSQFPPRDYDDRYPTDTDNRPRSGIPRRGKHQ